MPPPIPVELSPYRPEWPQMAARYVEDLRTLEPIVVTVHHIGSTSVPGLAAKPIIDLMPVVTDLGDLDREHARIESLGYGWHGEFGIRGRRYCTLSNENGLRLAQLHFFQEESPQIERHLAFRDYLRAHPETAAAYEKEKRRARDLHPNDSHAYTNQKAMWIQNVEAKALQWRASQQLHHPHIAG